MNQLLLNDLCCRLPHGVLLRLPDNSIKRLVIKKTNPETDLYLGEVLSIKGIKPILYPLSEIFLSDEENPIPICNDWRTDELIKVVPIIELAKKLVPDAVSHKTLKNGIGVISTLLKTRINPYPLSFNTYLRHFTETVIGIDLCNKFHIDYHNLAEKGLAERIEKYNINNPYETENKI